MKLLKFILFVTFITYGSATPLPDTNIQIQHYDGPVYLGTTPPNCCPFCNSILKPQSDNGRTCEPPPEIVYPQPYGNTCENEPYEITISLDAKDANSPCKIPGKDNNLLFRNNNSGKVVENSGLHTDALKTGSIHNIPVTSTYGMNGNTYSGTGIGTRSPFGTDIFGTVSPMECKPLSNYLPINTASQNTCQVPILTYNCNGNSCNSDEPVLVPQKFMYSLILDGEVGSNPNACDSRMYYY